MAARRQLEFFLLRYAPNVASDEFVNIGLVMMESGGDGGGFADVHFTKDWKRARSLWPDTDVEMLEAIGREIKSRVANAQDRALLIYEMTERYSNAIQLSAVRQVLAEDPAAEMKYLASTLVEAAQWMPRAPQSERPTRRAGRQWIHSGMTAAFEAAAVLALLTTKMPVSSYTNETDKFTFDFAYSFGPNGDVTRVFHAVSLVDKGKATEMFPFRVAKIAPKMAQLKKTKPTFMAIVEDHYDARDTDVASVIAFMKDEDIQVLPLREMPAIAAAARVELGV
jgi:hypothetical protein